MSKKFTVSFSGNQLVVGDMGKIDRSIMKQYGVKKAKWHDQCEEGKEGEGWLTKDEILL